MAEPATRRRFSGVWDEIDYLYDKVLFWFYDKNARKRAAPFAKRLARLLRQESAGGPTPFTEGACSLLHELGGDLAAATVHRENESRLLKRLFQVAIAQANFDLVLAYYDFQDLADRLDLLAILYHDTGRLDDAIKTLEESRQLAATHGFKFDGADLLKDYGKERTRASAQAARGARRRRSQAASS